MNNPEQEQIFDGGIHKSVEQPTSIHKPIQWKVGDIFAPEDPKLGTPIAIIQAPNSVTDYCYIGMSEVNGLMSLFCTPIGEVVSGETVTKMLTKANARKIGELTWNILVEEKK